MSDFYGKTIFVKGSENLLALMIHLEQLGHRWCGGILPTKNINHLEILSSVNSDGVVIYINSGGLSWDKIEDCNKTDILRPVFKIAVEVSIPETVQLNGKTYLKEDLEKALQHIKPIE